jgi:glycosyltransferase involved in cell wall biosynthesis
MMEAQSAGIPILAADVGGVNEIVVDGITGWLLPSNPQPDFVAEKIREIFKMKKVEKNMIRGNALIHWQKNFDATKNYPEFIILLKSN